MSTSRQRRIAYAQNFLHSVRLVRRLVDASSLGENDVVLEIGPGDGAITGVLVETCRHVLAVEKDPYQVERLRQRFGNDGRLTLFSGDFLDFPPPCTPYKVFASIPYNATAAIVGKVTTGLAPPEDTYLVVQREAALRFIGEPVETLVGLEIKPWFEPSIMHTFRRTDFRPVPAVESVLLRIERRRAPLVPDHQRSLYLDFMAAMFTAWKATVREAARATFPKRACDALDRSIGGTLDRRPSEVELATWIAAFQVLVDLEDARAWSTISGARKELERQQENLSKRRRTNVAIRRRR